MKRYFVLSALLLALSVSAFSQTCQYHFEVRSLRPWNGYYWNQNTYTWGGEDTVLTFDNIDPTDSIRLEYNDNQGCAYSWGRASLYKDGVKIDTFPSLYPNYMALWYSRKWALCFQGAHFGYTMV